MFIYAMLPTYISTLSIHIMGVAASQLLTSITHPYLRWRAYRVLILSYGAISVFNALRPFAFSYTYLFALTTLVFAWMPTYLRLVECCDE